MPAPKYIFPNGVMQINPEYLKEQGIQSTLAQPAQALAIVSSPNDIAAAMSVTQDKMVLSNTTTTGMQTMQSEKFVNQFNAPNKVDAGKLVDGIAEKFDRLEIPIGLLHKFLVLSSYRLNFILDDSGSMSDEKSKVKIKYASEHTRKNIKQRYKEEGLDFDDDDYMTRWEEAEDRLHVLVSMLQFIPATIRMSFFHRPIEIILNHDGKSPIEFARDAHHQIKDAFSKRCGGKTPLFTKLSNEFRMAQGSTMHYVFTDGVPTDASIDQVTDLVVRRANPQLNPVTFISCSNVTKETAWLKEVDEKATFTAELDNFETECKEVLHDQGPAFPYSKGIWYLCQLIAAINPDDLDALDEDNPLSKRTLNEVLGRILTPQEYEFYFRNHPKEAKFKHLYQQFSRDDLLARDILRPAPLVQPQPGYAAAPGTFFQPPQQQPVAQPGGYGMNNNFPAPGY